MQDACDPPRQMIDGGGRSDETGVWEPKKEKRKSGKKNSRKKEVYLTVVSKKIKKIGALI